MSTPSAAAAPPPPQLLAVMTELRAGNFERALEAAELGLREAPDRGPFLAFAGLAAQRLGAHAKAVQFLRELHALNPADLATRANLAKALIEAGDKDAAFALAKDGETPALARIEGYLRQDRGDLTGAIEAYRRVLAQDPTDSATLNNLGNALGEMGAYDEAIHAFEHAITQAPREVEIYLNLAHVLQNADRGAARLKVARDAVTIAPGHRFALTELALALAHDDRFEEALAALEDISRRFPDFGESQLELGRMYESFNRLDDLRKLVNRYDGPGAAAEGGFLKAWLAQREGRFDDAADHAQSIPESIHPMRRYHLIGSIEERRGNATAAFEAFERMNRDTQDAQSLGDRQSYRGSIEDKISNWTPEWAAAWKPGSIAQAGPRDPIFLVGFPRSGTTLLDTMLMGIPSLSVLEERPMVALTAQKCANEDLPGLNSAEVDALREEYFMLAREYGWDDTKWLVDKHPLNMARVPLIHRLFPEARFILAERHPYDVVLSCFMANFQLNFAMRSFTDLEEAARTYDAVFTAWETAIALFDIPYRAVRYERLVLDPVAELAPLIEWLGLEWNDRLIEHTATAKQRGRVRTASYAQIGEKLYTRALGRWKRYAEQLEPVVPILKPWAQRMGYETA